MVQSADRVPKGHIRYQRSDYIILIIAVIIDELGQGSKNLTWPLFTSIYTEIKKTPTDNQFVDHLRVETGKGKGSKGSGGRGTRLNAIARNFGVTPSLFCFLFGEEVFPGCRSALRALKYLKEFHPDYNIKTLFAAYESISADETSAGTTTATNLRNRFKNAISSLEPKAWQAPTTKNASSKEYARSMPAILTLPASEHYLSSDQELEDDVSEENETEEALVATTLTQPQNDTALVAEQSRPLRGVAQDHSVDGIDSSSNSLDTAYFPTDGKQDGTIQRDDNDHPFSPGANSESEEEPEQQRNNPHTRLSMITGDTQASFHQPLSPCFEHGLQEHATPCPGGTTFFGPFPTPLYKSPVCGSAPLTPTRWDDSFQYRVNESDTKNPLDRSLCRKRPAAPQEDLEITSKQMRLDQDEPENYGRHLKTFGLPKKMTSPSPKEPTKPFNQATKRATRPYLEMLNTAGESLKQEQWLNDVAVNTLLGRLSGPATAVLDSLTVESQLTARRSSMLRERLKGKDVVLIPVNENAKHWLAFLVKFRHDTQFEFPQSVQARASHSELASGQATRGSPRRRWNVLNKNKETRGIAASM
ncbi:Ulp1 protease family protein [Colletotrichum higginsianum IMI 349063]|uniref:Ulp1 protease family protein n=1 Tax=Colletotrichum higginsianum (strain IMI 349063) TaxID=759273 RepID=A0A1B7XQZ3_COLHI|nr:Ulp1 protease family protein [Colletotrichum higginsianum IMI 349063]OBR02177.1 Ulp1 protease family protein [Colletotrichum higginsianum IMI 349063]